MTAFSTPFFVTLANNRFLYGKKDIGVSLRDDEELGAHTGLLCFESKKHESSITTTTSRYIWSHPGLKPFGNVLPIQCPGCWGLRTWSVRKKTADDIHLKCMGAECSQQLYFSRPPALDFVSGRYVDDGQHGQWLKENLGSETFAID